MAANPVTPNMGITLPIPGTTLPFGTAPAGESWGEFYNTGLSTIDQHDHTSGKGLRITSAALNINADLPFNSHNATSLRSTRFTAISLGALGVSDIGCLVVSGADLYYVDTAGNQIRMTSGGAVAGAPGSISGLAAPASASYASGPKLFSFDSGTNTVGGIACGPLVLTDSSVPSGFAATIQVPAGLAADYQLTLPGALPAHTQLITMTSAGVIATSDVADNTSLQFSSGTMSIKDAGVTRPKLAAVGQQRSSSTNNSNSSTTPTDVPGFSVTLTTAGRPVIIVLGPVAGAGDDCYWRGTSGEAFFRITRDGTSIGGFDTASSTLTPASGVWVDVPSAGSHTYKLQSYVLSAGSAQINNAQLTVYEL